MPAGIEIMIAMEKPKAIITNSALIFRLEIFLTALVTMPKFFSPFKAFQKKRTTKKREWREGFGCFYRPWLAVIL
jgi:hypothetical protein